MECLDNFEGFLHSPGSSGHGGANTAFVCQRPGEDWKIAAGGSVSLARPGVYAKASVHSHSDGGKGSEALNSNRHQRIEPPRTTRHRQGNLPETKGSPLLLFPVRQHGEQGNRTAFLSIAIPFSAA